MWIWIWILLAPLAWWLGLLIALSLCRAASREPWDGSDGGY